MSSADWWWRHRTETEQIRNADSASAATLAEQRRLQTVASPAGLVQLWHTPIHYCKKAKMGHKWKSLSSTLAVILYAEFMFSYATLKKLPTTFLNQKWLFQPLPHLFTKRRPKKAKNNYHIEGRKIFFPSLGTGKSFPVPRDRKMDFSSLCMIVF